MANNFETKTRVGEIKNILVVSHQGFITETMNAINYYKYPDELVINCCDWAETSFTVVRLTKDQDEAVNKEFSNEANKLGIRFKTTTSNDDSHIDETKKYLAKMYNESPFPEEKSYYEHHTEINQGLFYSDKTTASLYDAIPKKLEITSSNN